MGTLDQHELDLTGLDDRAIQKMLRKVDSSDLALAIKDSSEEIQQKIYRNMSKRACALLQEEMNDLSPKEKKNESATLELNRIIDELIEKGAIARGQPTTSGSVPAETDLKIDTSTRKSVTQSLLALAKKASTEGLLSVEDDLDLIDNLFLRRGLRLVVDGTDPFICKGILSDELDSYTRDKELRIKEEVLRMESELNEEVTKRKMIIEGVLSVQACDSRSVLAERLWSFDASS